MGELLILALGRALYTRKHCLDKAVNVGSIPTSPTKFVLITMCQNSLTEIPTAREILDPRTAGRTKVTQTASHSQPRRLERSQCRNALGTFKHKAVLLSI